MNLLLVAVNAKYIHSNLAVKYLSKKVQNICPYSVKEYSVNDNVFSVERDIILSKPDALAFSCYIWNIDFILLLCNNIKKALPECVIILGGPEVGYDAAHILDKHSYVDYVVKGEGEITFPCLINHIINGKPLPHEGVTYRNNGEIVDTPFANGPDFSDIPFPYDNDFKDDNKIIYYESSRGCPYSCKYCLSGEKGKVRFKDVDTVKKELEFFSCKNIPLVKFVDRTFNADRKRALKIWEHIFNMQTNTRFHMEITGELLDDDTILLLQKAKRTNLQFEIGVQSTNPQTLKSINRVCNTEKLFKYIKLLLEKTDIHVHLDLIVGLPHEDIHSFEKSFNDVLSLKPHVLQIGFLKVLKGSAIRTECEKYGIVFRDNSPYEIISNKFMSYEDILFLKDLEFVFDKYYNSGTFSKTMDFLFGRYINKFNLFSDIVKYFRKHNYINMSFSKQKYYDILYDCFSGFGSDFEEALRYDFIYYLHVGKLPLWCNTDNEFTYSQAVYDFLKNDELKHKVLPHLADTPAKSIIKHVRFEKFSSGVLMFDYINNDVYDVTDYIDISN